MNGLQQQLSSIMSIRRDYSRWVVAFSGGLDSTVLLHSLVAMKDRPELCALHINHGLQQPADDWQRHCEAECEKLSIPCVSLRVSVSAEGGPEQAARQARYQAFEEFLSEGDLLLQAHHLDDQVETLFLRLLRGTGADGFRGIPVTRALGKAELYRPLLDITRADLEAYAQSAGLKWVEDPSNQSAQYDRNYLRQKVLPLIELRWPAYRQTVARSAQLLAVSDEVLPEIVLRVPDSRRDVIDLVALRALSESQRNQCLRQWLAGYGVTPSHAQLQDLQRSMLWSGSDSEPLVELGGFQLRRFQDHLYLTQQDNFESPKAIEWGGLSELNIPGAGVLCALSRGNAINKPFEIRFRQGGERCQPVGRKHSQSLKKLLQDAAIPPWHRDRLPLIYLEGELAAVADLWLCQGFEDRLSGWTFSWQPDD